MKYVLLLLMVLSSVSVVESGKKGGKGGCSPKKLKKSTKQYEKCVKIGFRSTLGCKWVEPLKPLKSKQVKKCKKVEKLANKCGYKCPVDGGWSMFGNWTECSADCAGGSQTRNRTCDNPAPKYGGAKCKGVMEESQECNTFPCPGEYWRQIEYLPEQGCFSGGTKPDNRGTIAVVE